MGLWAAQLSNENKTLNGGGRIKHPAQRTVDLRLFKGEFNKQHREKMKRIPSLQNSVRKIIKIKKKI